MIIIIISQVLSGVALVSYRAANVPKDKEHPYGHGKFETLGALGISAMLLATGSGIAWHALDLLSIALSAAPEVIHSGHHHGIDMNHPILALTVTIASISIKEGYKHHFIYHSFQSNQVYHTPLLYVYSFCSTVASY
jgi:divalent metal cation (Fe/Co/Zn/Cd) transporter